MHCASFSKVFTKDGIYRYSTTETTVLVCRWKRSPRPKLTVVSPIDLGKVLAGIQVPEEDTDSFGEFLKKLDYSYVEETQNVVYKRFLG